MRAPEVLIADERPMWIREEDNIMLCFNRCGLYKVCSSRFGAECKKLGGNEIPKIQRKSK